MPCSMLEQGRASADDRPLLDAGQNGLHSVLIEDLAKAPGEEKGESKASLPVAVLLATMLTGLWRPVCTSTDVDNSKHTDADGRRRNFGRFTADDGDSCGEVDDIEEEDVIANAEHWSVEKTKVTGALEPRLALYCNEVIFLAILVFFNAWLVNNLQTYVVETWGQQKYALDAVAYCCYTCQILMVVAHALMESLRFCLRMLKEGQGGGSINPFDIGFIRNRITFIVGDATTEQMYGLTLNMSRLVIFLSLPLANAVIKIVFSVVVLHSSCDAGLDHFSDIIASFLFFPYGSFWYLVYVERVSLHCQLNRSFRELRRAARRNDIDRARRLIDSTYAEFHAIQKTTARWSAVTMATVPIMLTYLAVFTYKYDWGRSPVKAKAHWIFSVLFVQDFMFCILTFFSMGGVNLKNLWRYFCHVISKAKIQKHVSFWSETEQYVSQIDTLGGLELQLAVLSPVLGVVVCQALASNHNMFQYWSYQYDCANVTTVSPSS
ncbi:uncharacterized protein [Diadema setosum]|uniref:uncharacterized protein n=1 Tax=Diadema setosum TaxID=31175 RepID=UPI003B3A774E